MSRSKTLKANSRGMQERPAKLSEEEAAQQTRRIQALAETFPCLRVVEGVRPWDPQRLYESAAADHRFAVKHSVAFVLDVWGDPRWATLSGPFDVAKARKSWDEEHRAAWYAWCAKPWWPKEKPRRVVRRVKRG